MAKDFIIRSGGLGVSQTPVRATLHVSGTISGSLIRSSGDVVAFHSSDERLKDNLKPIEGATYKLQQVGGYEFDWNKNLNSADYIYFEKKNKLHSIGLIAQNIRQYYPEVVELMSSGYYRINYPKLNAVLVEGIKEQQVFIEDIEPQLIDLEVKLK